ncbi:hypothetical protein MTBPR1_60032 [Candidatus Terasakiella magnetica]|uniref:Uncharacterized protein n=1 Tax=Candidatus Terasakiella magnetica TaxID=1867952 RepID=A0A1C3RJU6_9PROT|nr:DUF6626 family protein [Candidatus Terasakiella magnetica]SCA57519.1 hypothetical protein MTBPR1_60032 [Candidatus Terasakiella magnetica]
MQIVKEIYEFTRANNLADNECDFSLKWLNKSARYYNMIKLTGRDASFDALIRLSTNLQLRQTAYKQSQIKEMQDIGNSIEAFDQKLHNVIKARTIAEAISFS